MAVSTIPNQFRMLRRSVNTGSFSINGNTEVNKEISFIVDSGYTFFGINRVIASTPNIVIGNCYDSNGKFILYAKNITSNQLNVNIYVEYLISKG